MPPAADQPGLQVLWLFVLAIPVASIAWTVTHEEVFREPRDFCKEKSENCDHLLQRKFFYLFTCEYCFSHYISLLFIFITGYKLLMDDWRGYLISFFATVWVSNAYMSLFSRLRVDIRSERALADEKTAEAKVKIKEAQILESAKTTENSSPQEQVR
jgi:hypothetical protein